MVFSQVLYNCSKENEIFLVILDLSRPTGWNANDFSIIEDDLLSFCNINDADRFVTLAGVKITMATLDIEHDFCLVSFSQPIGIYCDLPLNVSSTSIYYYHLATGSTIFIWPVFQSH